jgi:hypothetical protein
MNEKKSPIRGKVARILSSRQLALNIGEQHGVTVGMKFDVLDPKGHDITDPDSGEVLGSLRRRKVRVEVIEVQERLSLAQTFRKSKINIGGTGFSATQTIADMLKPPKWVTKYETFRTDEQTWEDLDEDESIVKTGDPIVQVIIEEKELNGEENNAS